HHARGLLGAQIVDRERARRRQRDGRGGERDAHQKLQPRPRLTRFASRFSRKRCRSALTTTPGVTWKFAPTVTTRSVGAADGVKPGPRSAKLRAVLNCS